MKIGVLVGLLMVATPAHAERFLFFGDSNMGWGGSTSIPALTMLQQPGDTHCISSVNGRNSVEGLAQIDAAITACGGVTHVVVQMGIADILEVSRSTPLATAERLIDIGDAVAARGAVAIIGTPPPAPVWGPFWFGYLDGNTYTRDVGNHLYEINTRHTVIDQRDASSKGGWNACSTDQLHYSSQACRKTVADLYAGALP